MFTYCLLLVFILFNTIQYLSADDPHWNYGSLGPDVWEDLYPSCGDSSQSPINIRTTCTTYQSFPAFQFSSNYNITQQFVLTNNGHTIVGTQVNASAYPLTLTGGGLDEPFTFANFHLHWGENYNSGSEHQLNGEKYAGEIHFVHKNADQTKNAVLAIFMKSQKPVNLTASESSEHRRRKRRVKKRDISNTDNATSIEWHEYFKQATTLQDQSNTTSINLILSTLMGKNLDKFYRYSGSLTTPPCTENVIWTVFGTPVEFTDAEIATFRAHVLFEDYRGPQPLNGRTVYRNFPNATMSPISDYACCGNTVNQTRVISSSSTNGSSVSSINKQFVFYILFFIIIFLI